MNWRDASDFFAMGGYALYVWGAYGVMLALMILEPVLAWQRHRAARAAVVDDAEFGEDESLAHGAAPQAPAALGTVERAPVTGARP